ncbi:MAG: cell division protein FtsW [Bacteroidales bacterium]|nr:cell division protein FtsW [Bacteroidales bacterium]MBN2817973.1 cell division protein FtsW [Bacteroidales bacterium]
MVERLKKYLKGDSVIWGVIIALMVFSMLAVFSSTKTLAYRYHGGNAMYYWFRHSAFLFIGFITIYFVHLVPYKYFSRLSQLLLYISVPLLAITLVFGTSINDASRWLRVPGIGLTFQTSDLAKIVLIMFLARMLSLKQDTVKSYRQGFLPLVAPVIVICGLIMPANLSTAVILFGVSMILMFIGRIRFAYIFGLSTLAIAVIIALISIMLHLEVEGTRAETWKNRVENYISQDDKDASYQSDQSKIAIATGGFIGRGPGNSVQRDFLPHPYSDFIFAIIVEEYGLIGGMLVIFLYLYLLFRAGVIVNKSSRTFQAFLAYGLTLMLVLQAMVNMAVAVGIFPVTGQPLPLISMGGTSILFTAAALGMILSVSRSIEKELKLKAEAVAEAAVENEE